MIPIILDTDIGGDVDDALALAFALNCPEISLAGVTTVNTDPARRARIAGKMLDVYGRCDVPVAPGSKAMFDGSPTLCKDINHAVLVTVDDPPRPGDATALILDVSARHRPVIVGIGCWTNIALAFQHDPGLSQHIDRLILMGGCFADATAESNIICDPSAAAYVLNLPAPKLLVPLDVTMRCRYRAEDQVPMRQSSAPRAAIVRDAMRAWQLARFPDDPGVVPVLHDALAVALAFDTTLIRQRESLHVDVIPRDDDGAPITRVVADEPANADVVLDVDVARFEALFARRIAGAST